MAPIPSSGNRVRRRTSADDAQTTGDAGNVTRACASHGCGSSASRRRDPFTRAHHNPRRRRHQRDDRRAAGQPRSRTGLEVLRHVSQRAPEDRGSAARQGRRGSGRPTPPTRGKRSWCSCAAAPCRLSNMPRPDNATYDVVATWLETELDRAALARPNPGRPAALHRLNRTEYANAVRDLLGNRDRRGVDAAAGRAGLRLRHQR